MTPEELKERAQKWREQALGKFGEETDPLIDRSLADLLEQVAAEARLDEHDAVCAKVSVIHDGYQKLTKGCCEQYPCPRRKALAKQSGRG